MLPDKPEGGEGEVDSEVDAEQGEGESEAVDVGEHEQNALPLSSLDDDPCSASQVTVWGPEDDLQRDDDDEEERFTFGYDAEPDAGDAAGDPDGGGSGLGFVFGRYEPTKDTRKLGVQFHVSRWESDGGGTSRIRQRLDRV